MSPADPSVCAAVSACKLCDKGTLAKSVKSQGNRSSTVCVFYPHDQIGGHPDDDTMETLARVRFSTGVSLEDRFRLEPMVRCIVPKLQKRYVSKCAIFRPAPDAFSRNIVIGKAAIAHLLYDGFMPPSFSTWHGRLVSREETEYLLIASVGDVYPTYDSSVDADKFYTAGLLRAKEVIERWAKK